MIRLSLIICTHNPRLEYLNRVFESLKAQTLPRDEWELLLIDNRSDRPLSETVDLSWHPAGRHIREEELGLTPARLRGIREAGSELLLFVDDDNCLKGDYLEICVMKMENNALLGTLGAGKIMPEYEVQPPPDTLPFVKMLALRNDLIPHFSNAISFNKAIPYGAGLCIRKSFALDYLESCRSRPFSSSLGRNGAALLSGEDVDMALHACKANYLAGVIPELEIIHIIPRGRLDPDYLVRIAFGHAYSHFLLGKVWGYHSDYAENPLLKNLRYYKKVLRISGLSRRIYVAEQKAIRDARAAWSKLGSPVALAG
ncbi:glycosyltransferase [Larkinella soli]|uniref:glycosyltransferase n=1 Tax=Larkinella soli TaxID=1770527 RepID=UPI000FFB871D|nr:glycosyltransferase [Larkinella soli]